MVEGQPPMDDIYLDGESLGYLQWTIQGGILYVYMEVSKGFHQVRSSPSKRFSAYVYSHTTDFLGGYGYAVRPDYGMNYNGVQCLNRINNALKYSILPCVSKIICTTEGTTIHIYNNKLDYFVIAILLAK